MKRFVAIVAVLAAALTIVLNVAVAAPGSQVAKANTITLVCNNEVKRVDLIPHITVDLNQAEGMVTVNYPATSIAYPGRVIDTAANSVGPIPATFNSKTIAFDVHDAYNKGFYQRYTLDA